MSECGFCSDCGHWRFESNPQLQNDTERDGFGICERLEQMSSNRMRALARADDEFAHLETRAEFGCILYEAR
ncbi:MAG: hypothetical protein DRR03_07650 [Gammaproteobacteria bacterium]|jgi:hypothetical protein|nr:MAG: hypothetical protein DRR03_07650 [Gammaproteobacteria bacterium]